jgi:histidine ammonia-lyase
LFTASQALSFANGKSSPFIESIVGSFRQEVSIVEEDRVLHYDIKNASNFITSLVIDSDELFG